MRALPKVGSALLVFILILSLASSAQPVRAQSFNPTLQGFFSFWDTLFNAKLSIDLIAPAEGQVFGQGQSVQMRAVVRSIQPPTVDATVTLPDAGQEIVNFVQSGPRLWEATFNSTSLPGDYHISATATSSQGSATENVNFHVNDITPPQVEFVDPTPPTGTVTSNPDVTINVSHFDHTPDTLTLYVDSAPVLTQPYSDSSTLIQHTFLEGSHDYYVMVDDTYGNFNSTEVRTITVDTQNPVTTPSLSGTPGSNGWYVSDVDVTLTCDDGQGSGCDKTYYCVDQAGTCDPDTEYSAAFQVSTEDENYVRFYSTDLAGHQEQVSSEQVNVDKAPPLTTNDAPVDWIQGPVSVTLTPSDAVSGVFETWYCVDQTDTCDPEAGSEGTLVDVSTEGTNYVRYNSIDFAGNHETPRSATVMIDNTPPTTTDDSLSFQGWQASHPTLTLIPADPLSGVFETLYCVDQAGTCDPDQVGTSPSTFYEGDNYVVYHSTDNAGNQETPHASLAVAVDTVPPTSSAGPLDQYTLNLTFDVPYASSDATSGVASVELFYDINSSGTWASYGTFVSSPIPFTASGDGFYEFYTVATDNAGNQEAKAPAPEASTMVDTWDPVLTAQNPLDGQTYPDGDLDYIVAASEGLVWATYEIDQGGQQPLDPNTPTLWESIAGAHPTLSDGSYTITFRGADLAGREADPEIIGFTVSSPPNETYCNSCAECSAALNGTYEKVILAQDLLDQAGTCITFNADGVTFDGGDHVIDGISGWKDYGIVLNGKSNIIVQNANIQEFGFGILGNLDSSTNVGIYYNHINRNRDTGIGLIRGNNFNVVDNFIELNYVDGIALIHTYGNNITDNIIQASFYTGLNIYNMTNSVIESNDIKWNGNFGNYGIKLDQSNGNLIYHNNIITNDIQAFDNGVNDWDDGVSEGNYWNDLVCINPNPNGIICDDPYLISGGNNQDNYPFLNETGWF